jgi:uncharacterized RDD family membrane protein YckC
MLDTPRVVPTPEGIELTIKVAGPVARARAWIIDILIRMVVYMVLGPAFAAMGKFGIGLFLIILFLLEWGYPIFFEVYWKGATPGKRVCHLRVLHDNGTPVGWRASFTRNTIRAADFLPFGYGFGLVAMLMNRDFKRLGDMAAGTVVIYVDQETKAKPKAESATMSTVPESVPSLSMIEQRAIIDYVSRLKRWSDDRQVELAMHAGIVLNNQKGRDAVDRLVGLASHYTGRVGMAAAAGNATTGNTTANAYGNANGKHTNGHGANTASGAD